MKGKPKRDDAIIRAYLMAWWSQIPGGLKVHCGGHGLAVGCPVCGKRWGR